MRDARWKKASSPPWLIATTDEKHQVALVRSGPKRDPDLLPTLRAICDPDTPPVRSGAGGWIVSLDVLTDLQCLAQVRGEYIKVQKRRDP